MTRPNVLLICTDQHRYDVISTHPGSTAITPHLAQLAAEGTVFDHCYASNPVCAPTRASMLTGQLPSTHGLWSNGVRLPRPEDLVSHQLAETGYRCGLIGKLHLSAAFQGRTEHRLDDGFETFESAHDPFHGSPENAYHLWLQKKHPELWTVAERDLVHPDDENFKHRDTAFDAMPTEAHYSTWVSEQTTEFIEAADDRPFFCMANFYDPHHPFVAPQEYLDRYPVGSVPPPVGGIEELTGKPGWQTEASGCSYAGHGPSFTDYSPEEIDTIRRTYYAMVSLVDDSIARILESLRASGTDRDTMVIFTSDHGEMLGDHALLLKGAMMYECAVRVPMIIRWPGHVPAGDRVNDFIGSHDVARTIRCATGLPDHPRDQGIDLVGVAAGDRAARSEAITQYRDSGYPTDPAIHTTMLRTATHKLVVHHSESSRPHGGELYDLDRDPDELDNLFGSSGATEIQMELYRRLVDVTFQTEDRSAVREFPW